MYTKTFCSKSLVFSFLLVCGLLAFASSARAQALNATLSGAVTDPSGAAVVGAELTLTNKATGFETKSTSNERGEYTIRNLTPGTYDLKVAATGFETYIQRDIVITINASAHADAALKMGTATQTVTVEGGNTLINYENATLQEGIEPQTLQSLPLVVEGKLRSVASQVLLLPGVTTGGTAQPFSARINGGQETGDEALLDGASMQQGFMSQSGMISIHQDFTQSPDMVQEIKVISSDYEAQYGGTTSAVIAVVTKSGGTEFHGGVFEYARNTVFNAKPWNAKTRPVDIENDFGAHVGGPVKIPYLYHGTSRHKSFFYFNWESYHLAGGSSVPTISIPSALERTGNFTDWIDSKTGSLIPIYAPTNFAPGSNTSQATGPQSVACQNALPAGFGPGQRFPGNIIPSACISPIASAYLAFLPTPTAPGATSNYTLSRPVPDTLTANSNYYMFRIDHNYGDSDHFYFSYWRQYTAPNLATTLPRQIANDRFTPLQNSPILRMNWEHIFSNKMTNHVTLGYLNRNEGDSVLNLDQLGKLPQVPGTPCSATPPAKSCTLPSFNFSDTFQTISSNAANKTTRPTWVLNDVASRIIGHHTVTFGAEWRNIGGNIHFLEEQAGTFHFDRATTSTPGATSGSPIAGFLLGAVSTGTVDFRSVPAYYPRQKFYGLHANDSWRMTPKLTLNYGLRWDYFSPAREKHNHLSFIDAVGANPSAGGRAGRLAFAGNNSVCQATSSCFGREFPEEAWKKGFAPRVGVAYAYNPKTVVRAGYGVFFGRSFYPGWHGGMIEDGFNLKDQIGLGGSSGITPPMYLDTGFLSPTATLGCMLGTTCVNSGFDNGRFPIAGNGNGSAYRPIDGNHRPYSSQWNLTIERQLPQEVFVSVAYVGNKGTHLVSSLQPINVLNPFDPAIKALEANTTPIDPSCATGSPAAGVNCGYVPELNAVFTSDSQTLFGVTPPYAGWVSQLSSVGACAPTVAQALLPFPQFCGALPGLNESRGNSIYHSFQLKAEKRYSKGLYMLVSYTNSKLISDANDTVQQAASPQSGTNWNATQGVISPFEKRRARTISSDDVPQVMSALFVYDLPFGKGKRYANQGGALNYAVGGWQFSPVIHYSRGTPWWFRSSSCQVVPQFRQNCLVGLVPGAKPFLQDPNSYDPGKGPLLNAAAFEPVGTFEPNGSCPTCTGVYGYTGSGPRISNLRGPNYKNLDFSLTKNTKFGERVNFQLRFSFFNALNAHYFINNGVNNVGSSFAFVNDIAAAGASGFGTWNGNVSPPRTIQIAGRFEF